jgi:hypothetical protein
MVAIARYLAGCRAPAVLGPEELRALLPVTTKLSG